MNQNIRNHSSRPSTVLGRWIVSVITVLVMSIGSFAPFASTTALAENAEAPLAATTNTMTLSVISAADSATYSIVKGDAIISYKYMINIDNTGTTEQRSPAPGTGCSPQDAGYPDTCNWVSIAGMRSSAPIYTSGDQTDFASGGLTLPDGKYLISVLADNYKIDGAHFTVPFTDSGLVTVQMQPYDLPDATLQAAVFEDNAPTNSAPDVPAERGLAGFVGHIKDYIDEVTTDVYGAPLCGNSHCVSKCYVVDGGIDTGIVSPIDAAGHCPFRSELLPNATTIDTNVAISATAVIEGKLKIEHLGPNRYALSVTPPDRSGWAQTTTLEGNHDWDAWVMEGSTGLDTEFVVAGEPFPATFFGYIKQSNTMSAGGTGEIKGNALAVSAYIPPTGGIIGETGLLGAKPKDKNPIKSFYVSLSDLNNSDQTIYMSHVACTVTSGGCPFDIKNVPNGDYVLGLWDEPQDYIFAEQNVTIVNGELTDLGSISMLGWWTTIEGHVFNDLNENGKMDAGEPGIPGFFISMRTRENSTMDRGTASLTTDANGYYWMESAYPQTQWLVEEAYADGFQTTGITYQADNQATETTILGTGVDVSLHPVIGLGGRMDWGVKAYAPNTNGGIVGTVSYDTTRNELNPAYAAIEDWQPSISNLTVELWSPVDCTGLGGAEICDANGLYQLNADGSYKQGKLLNTYLTETWERPADCVARNVDGNPLVHGVDENVLPTGTNAPCLESPMMGVQFGPMQVDQGTPAAGFGASVDGNYGFGDACFNGTLDASNPSQPVCNDGTFEPLTNNADFLVKVNIPNDAQGRPMYKLTKEEDVNIANGDSFVPQVPPSACAGALHTVDVANSGTTDGYGAITLPDPSGLGGPSITVP
ncbi:MAG: SdrD B-like domain-containing protein, partial [Chloroflexota bacterium]